MTDATRALKSITAKKREQLHISAINMLEECGKRFEFRYVLGIRRPPAVFMHVGTAVDKTVAEDLGHKIKTGELMKRKDVVDLAASTLEGEQKRIPIELDPDDKRDGKTVETVIEEAREKSMALASLHWKEAAPIIQASHVQRKFSIDMDTWLRKRAKQLHDEGEKVDDKFRAKLLHSEAAALNAASRVGLDLAGEQDVVETIIADPEKFPLLEGTLPTGLVIRDTKTSGKSPTKSYMDGNQNGGIADDSDQLTTYALASLVLDGRLPNLMALDYLVYTPARHDTKYVPTKTTRDMNDVNTFLNRFSNAVHAYRRGIFVPAKADWWGCSETYCGYWSMCPYAKRPKQFVQIEKSK
ncbi:MAG TPA: PD-(D/E)XK nuclease family protein [Candidatus Acidoferrum sp.]|nr:PD-(D/E)XK nuclease family protein [Candidatus Acidoferrum sp.]